MKKNNLLFLSAIPLLFSSCVTYSYFQSTTNANSNPYHAIPLKSDSAKGASYVSGLFTVGRANDSWRDAVGTFHLNAHRSNNFGNFQSYYGATVALGDYSIADFNTRDRPYRYDDTSSYYHIKGMNKFFGYYGFNGGIDVVLPTKHGGEWRIIGIETSVQKEFGNYYSFRKNLRDSSADVIFRNNVTGTFGFFTEIIGKTRRGKEFGYKMSYGFMLNSQSDYTHIYEADILHTPAYFSHTLHWTTDRTTFFAQFNIGTRYAGSMQFGVNYKISKKRN